MTGLTLRAAGQGDAEAVALLHADSWRRHYRGAYSDAFLDGDVVADRFAVWSARLAAPAGSATLLAQNADAQRFYRSLGGSPVEEAPVLTPGGDASRLHGCPRKLRMSWPDVTSLAAVRQ